jgi:tetratricopeptide (TPR) repeat protein
MKSVLIAAAIALASADPQTPTPIPNWSDLVTRFEKGNATSDTAMLRAAVADAHTLADVTGLERERQMARYGAAYAAWRLAFLPGVGDDESKTLLEGADTDLREVIRMDARSAEARALLASVNGYRIRAGGSAMELGTEAQDLLAAAARLEPNNPRVLLEQGINTFHVPAEYGGSAERAEAQLRQSLALFEREPAGRPWPNWGRFDAHVWLGQVLAARGDKDGARAEYDRALTLAPDSGYVKYKLLPMLTRR